MIQIKTKVDDGPGSVRLCSKCAGTGIDRQWRVCDGCAGAGILVDNPAMFDVQLTIFANEVQPLRQFLASINPDLVTQDQKQTESVMGALQEIIGELDCIQIRPEHKNRSYSGQGDTWISEKTAKKKVQT
ncbi:hypothetical protein ACJJI3_05000 [Microbulbifer sp. ZKSA004]|uniref:hypothetical protein n=1 Tax=Microbulbifer sp. ZKSA004 TaxID=3243389 RepID=UPI004039B842